MDKNMIEIVKKIITNVLEALYQPFGFSIILAILFMYFYMLVREYGWKQTMLKWIDSFKNSKRFRRVFLLTFYTAMILFRTLLNRNIWVQPLSNVVGVWGLYKENGELTTEVIENFVLFIPFTILLLWSFQKRIIGESVTALRTILYSGGVVFAGSLMIEFLQLFLRLGTFQLSDLFYNTLGGFIGGLIYWCGYRIVHRSKK